MSTPGGRGMVRRVAPLPVAVVINFYKSDATFGDALASVLAQSRMPAEIVVVDDGSPAGTTTTLEDLPSAVRLVRLPANIGIGPARRAGSAATKAGYIAYLDADDRWPEHYLEIMVGALERHPDAPASYAAIARCWPDGRREVFRDKPARLELREAIVQSHFIPSGFILRRTALEAAGGWPDDRLVIEDWHLSVRLLNLGTPMVFVPEVAIDYAVGNPLSVNSRDAQVLRKWWRSLRQLKSIIDREAGPGASRRRFAKALTDRADRRRGISRMILHACAWAFGPPLR